MRARACRWARRRIRCACAVRVPAPPRNGRTAVPRARSYAPGSAGAHVCAGRGEARTACLSRAPPARKLGERLLCPPGGTGEAVRRSAARRFRISRRGPAPARSEEHTSELQSLTNLVCRLLLEKKKDKRHETDHADAYRSDG